MSALIVPEPTLLADTVNDVLREPALDLLRLTLPDSPLLARALADHPELLEVPYRVNLPDLPTVREPGPPMVTLQPVDSGSGDGSGDWPRVNVG